MRLQSRPSGEIKKKSGTIDRKGRCRPPSPHLVSISTESVNRMGQGSSTEKKSNKKERGGFQKVSAIGPNPTRGKVREIPFSRQGNEGIGNHQERGARTEDDGLVKEREKPSNGDPNLRVGVSHLRPAVKPKTEGEGTIASQ